MKPSKRFSISSRFKSIQYALQGLAALVKQEHNTWVHLAATLAVIIAGFIRGISRLEWMGICLAIGLVWITEAINTAIENFCDLVTEGKWHPMVKRIKDISAAAVLIAAMMSICIALLVFLH